jgi:hypothetical protein
MLTALCSGVALITLLFAPLLFAHQPRAVAPHASPSVPAVRPSRTRAA